MNETKLIFYRGTRGMGNVISIRYGNDRIILDFGAPFEPGHDIYDGTLRHRQRKRLKDALLLGKVPPVPGLFAKDLQDYPLTPHESSKLNTAVFISHLHLDHMSEADKIAKAIPVYIHEDGLTLQESLYQIQEEKKRRDFQSFRYHETIRVGTIEVMPCFSDHPCPGAAAFLIRTPDSCILYTGDIRFHGCDARKAFAEMEELGKEKIDLLICDATTTSTSHMKEAGSMQPGKEKAAGCISEQDIYDDIHKSLQDYEGLGIFNSYPRDVGMLKRMKQLGDRLGRIAVFEPDYALILERLTGICVPIYLPRLRTLPSYVSDLTERHPIIVMEETRSHPEKYLLQNSYSDILSLIDLEGIPGRYFQLFGEPLTDKDRGRRIQKSILAQLNLEYCSWSDLFSFSHCYPNHLGWLLETLKARTVVAVHSSHPEEMDPRCSRQIIPEEGREYRLIDGELL